MLSPETVDAASTVHGRGFDLVLVLPMDWRLGYHRVFTSRGTVGSAFGHFGFGGSGAWADPERELAVAYVCNRGNGTPIGDFRIAELGHEIVRCADRRYPTPRRDDTAYLVADTVNSTGAVILPGDATFHADGAMVGRGALELTAAGDDMKLGFGPLTGIKLERRIPDEIEGNRGLISKSSERRETAILRLRNLTGEEWPLRVIDRVPVSTQENLRIDWSADPSPDETDPEGKRGLLVWNGSIGAGEERIITLTTTLRWPEGQVLVGGD